MGWRFWLLLTALLTSGLAASCDLGGNQVTVHCRFDDLLAGQPCDTGRSGICAAGIYSCEGNEYVCLSTQEPLDDTDCNGLDDDCDGTVDNSFAGVLGQDCELSGPGDCTRLGRQVCTAAGAGTECQIFERCNGYDDDCDGTIDEEADCPCALFRFSLASEEEHTYLYCTDYVAWTTAQLACRSLGGYDLITLNSTEENGWMAFTIVDQFVDPDEPGDYFKFWWIGLMQTGPDSHAWSNGEDSAFFTEPYDENPETHDDCGRTRTSATWIFSSCPRPHPYICESQNGT